MCVSVCVCNNCPHICQTHCYTKHDINISKIIWESYGRQFETTDTSSMQWEATSYGQVKLAVTHHSISSDEPLQLECDKPLAFLMDPPKTPDQGDGKPPKKKQRKSGSTRTLTSKSFGSVLDLGKLKKAKRLVIGWRVRRPAWNPTQKGFFLIGVSQSTTLCHELLSLS